MEEEDIIDYETMAISMKDRGFRNIRTNAEYGGVTFGLIGEARAGLVSQTLLFAEVPILNLKESARIEEEFLKIDKASRSLWFGKIFTYCLFAEKVEENAAAILAERIRKNDLTAANLVRGGGGAIFIFDLSKVELAGIYYPRLVGSKILTRVMGDLLENYEPMELDDSETQVSE